MFELYQHVNGVGSPIDSNQVLTGVFKPNTYVTLSIIGNIFSASAYNNVDSSTLYLQSAINLYSYGGSGNRWAVLCLPATATRTAYPDHVTGDPSHHQRNALRSLRRLSGRGHYNQHRHGHSAECSTEHRDAGLNSRQHRIVFHGQSGSGHVRDGKRDVLALGRCCRRRNGREVRWHLCGRHVRYHGTGVFP
jgi:hypothetical protein